MLTCTVNWPTMYALWHEVFPSSSVVRVKLNVISCIVWIVKLAL